MAQSKSAIDVVQQAYSAFGRWERTAARPSGTVFESEWVHVFTVRDGRITRFWGMYDNEASAAARA